MRSAASLRKCVPKPSLGTSAINYRGWATPGATAGSAALDVARTVCRRAEREVVALGETGAEVNAEIVRFLNRLSDLCWLWARWVETRAEGETGEDVPRV